VIKNAFSICFRATSKSLASPADAAWYILSVGGQRHGVGLADCAGLHGPESLRLQGLVVQPAPRSGCPHIQGPRPLSTRCGGHLRRGRQQQQPPSPSGSADPRQGNRIEAPCEGQCQQLSAVAVDVAPRDMKQSGKNSGNPLAVLWMWTQPGGALHRGKR
jgi:hypothetical protein